MNMFVSQVFWSCNNLKVNLHDWFSDRFSPHEHLFEENLLKEASLRRVEAQKAASEVQLHIYLRRWSL